MGRLKWLDVFAACVLASNVPLTSGCANEVGEGLDASPGFDGSFVDAGPSFDAGPFDAAVDGAVDSGADAGPQPPDDVSAACPAELCWVAGGLSAACGAWTISDDFSSGRYGVHAYTSRLRAGVETSFTARVNGGAWSPAILVLDDAGDTLHDGRTGLTMSAVRVTASGEGAMEASVSLVSDEDAVLTVALTSWTNRAADFTMMLPPDASYELSVDAECEGGDLLSPPNFDEGDTVGGYYLLPEADPSGLYNRKPDNCSRGTRLLIDVLYTAAVRWRAARPELPPLNFRDLNEGSCSTVDHATHNDGTHADLTVTCGTEVACADDSAAIDLARILVDTGSVCGILFNDTSVQDVVNPYFFDNYSYPPWDPSGAGRFMRTVSGHVRHFHIRVFKPDGSCN